VQETEPAAGASGKTERQVKQMINLTKIAAVMIGTGLIASAAFAGLNGGTVNITLSDPVVVGSRTLPSGDYTISEVQLGAESVFVFRNDNGDAAAVATATRTASPPDRNYYGASEKTEITLSPSEDGTLHLKDMFIEGDSAGYHFMKK
jgi:hypothetical protein